MALNLRNILKDLVYLALFTVGGFVGVLMNNYPRPQPWWFQRFWDVFFGLAMGTSLVVYVHFLSSITIDEARRNLAELKKLIVYGFLWFPRTLWNFYKLFKYLAVSRWTDRNPEPPFRDS